MLSSGNNCPSCSNQSYVTRIGVINNLGWLLTLAPAPSLGPALDKPRGNEAPLAPAPAPLASSHQLVTEVTSEPENVPVAAPLAHKLPQLPSFSEPQEDLEVDVSSWCRVYEDLLREYGQERSHLHQDLLRGHSFMINMIIMGIGMGSFE